MATLDSSIVNIALPTLTKAFGTDVLHVKWVVSIYLLMITAILLPFGRLSDQYGRKKLFSVGYVVFTLSSALCAFSGYLWILLVARAIQGLGAAMLMANGPAVITANFPAGERGRALGFLSMVVSLGLISGPSIGGLLITQFGWQSIFLVNIPVGLVGLWFVNKHIPRDVKNRKRLPFDWIGAFVQVFLLVSFIVFVDPPLIITPGGYVFPISRAFIFMIVVVLLAFFVRIEMQAQAPLFDMSLLKNRTFWSANVASFLCFTAYSSVFVLMPFFLEEVLSFTPSQAGAMMTAIPLTIFVVAPLSGRLSDEIGSQGLSVLGTLVAAFGLFVMSGIVGDGLSATMSTSSIALGLSSIGLATGLFQSPNNAAILSSVPAHKLGVASALMATMRNLGLATGTGLATGLFGWKFQQTQNFVQAIHFTFLIAGFIAIGATLFSLVKRRTLQIRTISSDRNSS